MFSCNSFHSPSMPDVSCGIMGWVVIGVNVNRVNRIKLMIIFGRRIGVLFVRKLVYFWFGIVVRLMNCRQVMIHRVMVTNINEFVKQ